MNCDFLLILTVRVYPITVLNKNILFYSFSKQIFITTNVGLNFVTVYKIYCFSGSVLESILSLEACKMGLPSLEGLLSHPVFADETVTTVGIKPQLKVRRFHQCSTRSF